uniref:ZM domain-containing protein n=1 Tax=Caenorhabditis tropicalis TaxID=1561998 RepID=A0A1I7U579_9PELO
MNHQYHHPQQEQPKQQQSSKTQREREQQQRDRTNTVYYDAQPNFGTPPTDGMSSSAAVVASSGDYKDYKMGVRKASGSSDRQDDVLYERVHTERRHHHSTSSSSPYPQRPPSRDRHHPPTVIHHQIRSPSSSSGPVMMAPMSTSYDYSIGSSAAFRGVTGGGAGGGGGGHENWKEDFRPGPRATSAANIDALFAPRTSSGGGGSRMTAGGMEYSRRTASPATNPPRDPHKDYGVVGAYSQQPQPRATSRGSVRQHSNDYELDPRLNVTYPQFYVNDWKERHASTPTSSSGYPRGGVPRQSPSFTATVHPHPVAGGAGGGGRPRFASDAAVNRHLYEEVPMGGGNGYRSQGYGMRETAILDDYDNVPSEFLEENLGGRKTTKDERGSTKEDGESAIYQPGRYQPC